MEFPSFPGQPASCSCASNDHAAYLGHWLKILQDDQRAIFSAAAHAQRAADFLQQLQSPKAEQAA